MGAGRKSDRIFPRQSTKGMKRADAIAELKQWEAKIRGGEISFEEAARQRSDCGSFAAVSFVSWTFSFCIVHVAGQDSKSYYFLLFSASRSLGRRLGRIWPWRHDEAV